MTTRRNRGLTTSQGHFLYAVLLGDRSLARRLESSAGQDVRACAAVLEGAFVVVIGRMCQNRFGPAEINLFSQRVVRCVATDRGATAEEVSRIIHRELDGSATGDDVGPARPFAVQTAVVATAIRELRLPPGEVRAVISESESHAKQRGFELRPYRPSLLTRRRLELAEERWHRSSVQDR
ncbi:hypothetical protein ACIBO1_24060 [Micromonospora sp. NPDC049903]|uniref:hypothetical protein n=1 Tax=Micromonospora sp. NPDC049903 TaxID=3364276 RepID=UPI0037B07067